MLSQELRQQAADALYDADTRRHLIPQLSKRYDGIELEDAYAIQDLWLQMRIDRGARLVGRKIGLTSRAMQMASNFNEPDYGYLTDDMLLADGAQPGAERTGVVADHGRSFLGCRGLGVRRAGPGPAPSLTAKVTERAPPFAPVTTGPFG